MKKIEKYGFIFLILAILTDAITPYLLGFLDPNYHMLKNVISDLGDTTSPVAHLFFYNSIISGLLYVLALPGIYQVFRFTYPFYSKCLVLALGTYGFGDCILSGLFSLNEQQTSWDLSTWIHNVGSGLGSGGLVIVPLILSLIYQNKGNTKVQKMFLGFFILSLGLVLINSLVRLPWFTSLPLLDLEGFWQRASLLACYASPFIFAVHQLCHLGKK